MARKSRSQRSGHTILVVDDQEEILCSTRSLLEREGHVVLTAECGERALALLKERQVDLLLVDYFMPRMTGAQLVREVRAFDPFVQIILQTGYSGEKPARVTLADLDIQGYHDKAEGPEKLLLWVDVGLKAQRQLARARDLERQRDERRIGDALSVILAAARVDAVEEIAAVLAAEGYRVVTAKGAVGALDAFVRLRPSFLIVDDSLLDQSGAELIRRVRTLEPAATIVAQVASLELPQRRRIMRRLGLHGMYSKGEDPERLLELLDSAAAAASGIECARADQMLRGLILAKLCHDLRSCLNVIYGYTELLSSDPGAVSSRELLPRLSQASHEANELVQAYLDLAHLESTDVVVRREVVNIDALIGDLSVQAVRQIGARPLRFAANVPSSGAVIHTDGEKLRTILQQLLANAIKLSLEGPIILTVRFAADHTDFILTDSGSGLSASEMQMLLQSIDCGPEGNLPTTPGQGLGLAIVLRLSQLLGATLTAERAPGEGAVFTLSLAVPVLTDTQAALEPTVH